MRAVVLLLAMATRDAMGSLGAACSSSYTGDTNVESCTAFCSEKQKASHCKRCKCKGCTFCANLPQSATPAVAPAAAGGATSSIAGSTGDATKTKTKKSKSGSSGTSATASTGSSTSGAPAPPKSKSHSKSSSGGSRRARANCCLRTTIAMGTGRATARARPWG